MGFPRRQREVSHALDAQLVPDGAQIVRLVELHLVGDGARAKHLVRRVLQVPAILVLLHILADHGAVLVVLGLVGHGPPDLEVLDGIAVVVLGGTLPRDDVCAEGREAQLVDVWGGERGDDVAARGIHHRDVFGRGPRKIPAVGRVAAAAEVALGPLEAGQRLVDGRGVEEPDAL